MEGRDTPFRDPAQPPHELPHTPLSKFFRTVAGPDDTPYPNKDETPNVYYARMLKDPSFAEQVGNQSVTTKDANHFRYICNLHPETYIEEGSIVKCDKVNGRWWTIDKIPTSEDSGMVAYSFGSYVVVLDDRDGSILWGPTLITHEQCPAHPDADYWEQFRAGWMQSPPGPEIDGMKYLRATRVQFDRRGNLFVAYSLVEIKYIGDLWQAAQPVGAVTTQGMIRFDYDLENRTFSKTWQADYSKRFAAGISSSLNQLGWVREFVTNHGQAFAAFDVDDSEGLVFYAAAGWDVTIDDSEIMTVEHFWQLYHQTSFVNPELECAYMLKIDAETGEELDRWIAGQTGHASQLQPGQVFDVPQFRGVFPNSYPFPVGTGSVRTPGNGRVYVLSRAIPDSVFNSPGRYRREGVAGTAKVIEMRIMQFDYDGVWRDAGGFLGGPSGYDVHGRHDDFTFQWTRENPSDPYRLEMFVAADGIGFPIGSPQTCALAQTNDGLPAARYGESGFLMIQPDPAPGQVSAFGGINLGADLNPPLLLWIALKFCNWLRSGTDGFPIASNGYSGLAHPPVSSVDLHGNRGLIAMTAGFGYTDARGNQRRSYNLWLDRDLSYQPLPAADQIERRLNPDDGLGWKGFGWQRGARYGDFIRYDTNDDSGVSNGTAIWSFALSARDWEKFNTPQIINKEDRVYKVDQSANIIWSSLGETLNPTHELWNLSGSSQAFVPLAGEGLGSSCDVYDPRENPDSSSFESNFVGRRFVPADDEQIGPTPPDAT